jgi:hypothetical protein
MYSLFILEEQFPHDGNNGNPELLHSRSLSKDLQGAPPGSFIHHLAEVIGSISSVHKMAFFWQSVVLELRKLWSDWQPVPRMPLDAAPDLNSCLLHQEIQVVNCCIARKKRRKAAKESLDSLLKQASIDNSKPRSSNGESPDSEMYARDCTGGYVLRLGADRLSENLTLLETGEPIYSPTLQEGPIMTAELIKETEELVLRTGRYVKLFFFYYCAWHAIVKSKTVFNNDPHIHISFEGIATCFLCKSDPCATPSYIFISVTNTVVRF